MADNELKKYKYVYHLAFKDGETWEPFYVGRTNSPKTRKTGHRSSKKKDDRAVYQFIRAVEKQGLEWDLFTIKEVPTDEYCWDWERWWVIDYVRKGHTLMNMKHGDLDSLKEIKTQVGDESIRSYHDVVRARVTKEQAMKAARELNERIKKENEALDDVAEATLEQVARIREVAGLIEAMLCDRSGWKKEWSDLNTTTFYRTYGYLPTDYDCKRKFIRLRFGTAKVLRERFEDKCVVKAEVNFKEVGEVTGKNYPACYKKIARVIAKHVVIG